MASWLQSRGLAPCIASAALVLGMPSFAHAESDTDRSGARAAAESGLAAYNGGRYSDALDLLGRAESLVHAPTHLLFMARAADKLGRLVQAHELYLKIIREPLPESAPRAFMDAQQAAQREVTVVERRLPYLTINTDVAVAPGSKVTLDEREVPNVLVGIPFPVDPGNHVIVAAAAGGSRGEPVKVTLAESQRERVTVKFPSGAGESQAPLAPPSQQAQSQPTSSQPSAAGSAPAERDTNSGAGKGSPPILAYGAIGVGVVGAAIGTVFLVQRGSKQSDADKAFTDCKTRYCSSSEVNAITQLDKDAATAGTLAVVSYGVGAAALTAGLYLLFTGHSQRTATLRTPTFLPYIGPSHAGAYFRF